MMRFIMVDSPDPYSPGDFMIFRNFADAQVYSEPYDGDDPLVHVYDEAGNWYRMRGPVLTMLEEVPKADLRRVDDMLATLVREHCEAEPLPTIGGKLDQLLDWQEAERPKPKRTAWWQFWRAHPDDPDR
jgi:hypothetical protein